MSISYTDLRDFPTSLYSCKSQQVCKLCHLVINFMCPLKICFRNMSKPIPQIYLLAGNDLHTQLDQLPEEFNRIQDLLREHAYCEITAKYNESAENVFKDIHEKKQDLAVIHFAGHASNELLHLGSSDESTGYIRGNLLSDFLKAIGGAKLVFLNGCGTNVQAKYLLESGVNAVISTNSNVKDRVATEFAKLFYQFFKDGVSIKTAFAEASAVFKNSYLNDEERKQPQFKEPKFNLRSFDTKKILETNDGNLVWCLDYQNDESLNYSLKKKNSVFAAIQDLHDHHLVTQEQNAQLDEIQKNLYDFKPKSALLRLKKLAERVKIASTQNSKILSRIYHLMALCHEELNKPVKSGNFHVKAFMRKQDQLFLKSFAAVGYSHKGKKNKSIRIAEQVLEMNITDINSWNTILKHKQEKILNNLDQIPKSVKEDINFQRRFGVYLYQNKGVQSAFKYLNSLLDINDSSFLINYENRRFWTFVADVFIEYSLTELKNDNLKSKTNYAGHKESDFAYEIYRKIIQKLDKSELSYFREKYNFHLLSYLKNNDSKSDVLQMLETYKSVGKKKNNKVPGSLIVALYQVGEYKKLRKLLLKQNLPEEPNIYWILSLISRELCEPEKAKKYAIAYLTNGKLDQLDSISKSVVVSEISSHIAYCELQTEIDTTHLEELLSVLSNQLDQNEHRLLEAIYLIAANREKEKVSENLYLLEEYLSKDIHSYQFLLADCFSKVLQFQKAINILDPLLKRDRISAELQLYIHCMIHSDSNVSGELELLKFWRENSEIQFDSFLLRELELLDRIYNFEAMEVVARVSLNVFPNSEQLKWILIYSLYRQESKRDELRSYVLDLVLEDISESFAIWISNILISLQEVDRTYDLLYRHAHSLGNRDSRLQFHYVGSIVFPDYWNDKELAHVRLECVAFVRIEGSIAEHQITEETIQTNQVAKALYEKKAKPGDTFFLPLEFAANLQSVDVLQIVHKHFALFMSISAEMFNPGSGMAKVIDIPGESLSIDELNKELIRQFGFFEQDALSKRTALIESYINGEIGFLAVAQSAFSNVFDAYESLTNWRGFRVCPKNIFEADPQSGNVKWQAFYFKYNPSLSYVLDFTSIFLFANLTFDLDLHFNCRFVIGPSIKPILEELITNARFLPDEHLSLKITPEAVIPYHNPDLKQNRLAYLDKLMNWIDQHCEERIPDSSLMIEVPRDVNRYARLVFEALILAQDLSSRLIGDDLIYAEHNYLRFTVSSEAFLAQYFPKSEYLKIQEYLIGKNYLGLTLDHQQLWHHYSIDLNPIDNQRFNFVSKKGC